MHPPVPVHTAHLIVLLDSGRACDGGRQRNWDHCLLKKTSTLQALTTQPDASHAHYEHTPRTKEKVTQQPRQYGAG